MISASFCVSFLFCLGQKHNYFSRKMLIAASQKCVKPKSPSNSDYKALSSVGTVGLCSRSNLCLKVIKIFDQPEPRAALNGKEGGKLARNQFRRFSKLYHQPLKTVETCKELKISQFKRYLQILGQPCPHINDNYLALKLASAH